jgi:biopolymer transport protein ExbD
MKGLLQDYTIRSESRNLINLAPLIDVVFQLILFFLVTSSFTWYSGMKVKLPQASSDTVERPLETITLEISRDLTKLTQPERLLVRWWEEEITGEMFWPPAENVDPTIGLAALKTKLDEYNKKGLAEGRSPSVVIAGEESIPYQTVITVIDMCEQLGLSDIVLAIQRNAMLTPAPVAGQ